MARAHRISFDRFRNFGACGVAQPFGGATSVHFRAMKLLFLRKVEQQLATMRLGRIALNLCGLIRRPRKAEHFWKGIARELRAFAGR